MKTRFGKSLVAPGLPVRWVAIGLLVVACAAMPASPSDARLFSDPRCPFAMSFPDDEPAVETSETNASTATLSRSGLNLSAACIAEPGQASELVLDGPALNERLSILAGTLGVIGALVTAPAPPGASCGLIEGQKAVGSTTVHVRAKFCYAPGALFIVETSSDGSSGAEQAALAAIDSVTSR